jgi:hypothetical protein
MKQFLTEPQLDKLSDIFIAAGQVFLASIVIPFFYGLDKIAPDIVPSGLTLMFASWISSMLVVKGVKR